MNSYSPYMMSVSDPVHLAREKAKARELRQSLWWRQQLGRGICYYCQERFPVEELTMDHVLPISKGGKSVRRNVVVACKPCNTNKKNRLPDEHQFTP